MYSLYFADPPSALPDNVKITDTPHLGYSISNHNLLPAYHQYTASNWQDCDDRIDVKFDEIAKYNTHR